MALTPQHYELLRQHSAISDAVIKARGYCSLDDPEEVRGLGFSREQGKTAPVLAIPLWDVHGSNGRWQIRPDNPRLGAKGKVFKYETPKGGKVQLDVHPSVQPHLGDPSTPLWITEGVRKGDALVSAGACAIALTGGVWGFTGTNEHGGKVILPEWAHVALNDREVYVAYDSDLATKPDVEAAMNALWGFLRSKGAIPSRVHWPEDYQQKKWGVDDFLASGKSLEDLKAFIPPVGPLPEKPPRKEHVYAPEDAWKHGLLVTKERDIKETFSNLVLVLQHTEPWGSTAWYDVVRELPMLGTTRLSDQVVSEAALALGSQARVPIHSLRLVHSALLHLCRQQPRDLLQEWLNGLPQWDGIERLTEWLCDHAGVTKTAYTMGVSRLLPVSMVARAITPGCQCRSVVIFEGRENIGKSKLVELLASPAWYRDVSGSLEGKEAHMLMKGAWVVELSEMSSMSKTQDARLKAFVTMANDEYVPKYANDPVKLARRTILVGTMNPEGDQASLSGQTGNTRYYPLVVNEIDLPSVQAIHDQLFAEALHYYRAHPADWWQMSEDAEHQARAERELRRQRGVHEDGLANWLEKNGHLEVWWELIAAEYLSLPKDRWDRRTQMEVSKSLHALGWVKQPQRRVTYQGETHHARPWVKVTTYEVVTEVVTGCLPA